ncbi:hypothetical protein [Haloechinothrix salitolerans]|uniref:Uncharacterized protein n=1 Tax=Haloechinothrix salitolerans TaxID=926830 RepID=A0ABW2BXI2_9PSEU
MGKLGRTLVAIAALAMVAVTAPAIGHAEPSDDNPGRAQRQLPTPADPASVTPAPRGEFSTAALRDGYWHQGEFALWSRPGYVGDIYDTSTKYHKTYYGRYYVNSAITLYNTASSTANGNEHYRVIATNSPEGKGDRLKHLKYPSCNNVTCYAYTDLGWADNSLKSHFRRS